MGVALEVDGSVAEDASWLRKESDHRHINVAELEAVARGINLAISWGFKTFTVATDSRTVISWMDNTVEGHRRVRTKGASEMLIKRRLGVIRDTITEFGLTVTVRFVSTTENKADRMTRVPKKWLGHRDTGEEGADVSAALATGESVEDAIWAAHLPHHLGVDRTLYLARQIRSNLTREQVKRELTPMKKTKEILQNHGATFKNMFVTTPICCPSRSSILTGKYIHNHHTVNNSVSGNCNSLSWQQGPEKRSFAAYLKQHANYTTFFAGKYLNQYGKKKVGGVKHIPPGWDSWHGLQVGNSVYYRYTLSANGKAEVHGSDPSKDYLTDVIDKHWLLRQVPKHAPESLVNFTDTVFRNRWQTLLSVDDLVHKVYKKLEEKQMLDNTYIIFSSDNGFHLGQFSLPSDKRQLYEFDIRVPLLVFGPGILPGSTINEPTLNIDLAPTFLDLAGVDIPADMDGSSLLPLLRHKHVFQRPIWRKSFVVEYQGQEQKNVPGCPQYKNQRVDNCHPDCICEDSWNNTYSCTRTIDKRVNTILCHFKDNENFVEAYNMTIDPFQEHNLAYDWKHRKPDQFFTFRK
ncbi:N-acetylglucosamine-6-sulfatase [Nymphon striatum]|nr:N-acetylglucosamine-6-sulfatase [Nymphon striatum]